ncbi:ubiquinone biosynthesis hydroxylase [Kaistia dalseonensis]|uniref:2-octaprenyl-6-methoxyphenol hydroxylase n=1 Tax=Kaistia dalseonensis TaxID=410840 RepID=A0ABU0H5J7_9HYPH|nr:ubiquinone biosynthesis hydroxylase [Kaistia dalseonensis]MCX5494726.1 ubiquinone biosynthesis hydroxylase [Kaistia dalseonensis]MDQ0437307.1 2-octaprenyl-6-methoxyphenol hydroxylase [Kaistia dalseonensis]
MPQVDLSREPVDVLIAGGGYVGLSLALALKRGAPTLAVAIVDPAPAGAAARDARASAIAAAAKRMLDALGLWEGILPESQPITEMIVTDSRTRDPVRPVFLTFAGTAEHGEPFAHMVPNGVLVGALTAAAVEAGVTMLHGESVTDFIERPGHVDIRLSGGGTIAAKLLVAADGARSRLRDLAGIRTVGWSYGQSGIVATVSHERPHHGRAEEHFLPAGPFAILPLKGNRSSLVWTERTEQAERIIHADDFTFRLELERRFGHHLGAIEPEGPRRAYPLGLTLARRFVAPRFALCGDSAHAIHPIAGQGLNLGFKDAAALAETIVEAARLGLDPGTLDILERYERWRRFDTVQMGMVTDGLNRLFSNDNAALRIIRDVGLGLVDRLPRLKERFIGAASEAGGSAPRLLRGETL